MLLTMRLIPTKAVLDAVEELAVDLPEELASGKSLFIASAPPSNQPPCIPESDIASPEEWEDNSAMGSDSEIGLTSTP